MLSVLLFTGCQKVTEEELMTKDNTSENGTQDQVNARDKDDDHGCRLRSYETSDGYSEKFSYNQKGLADRWYVDFGDGNISDHHLTYDNKNRLKSIRVIFPGDVINYTLYNNDGRTTRATGYLQSTGELYDDIFYSYNHKGQMVKLDNIVADVHTRFYYDNKGYNTRSDFFVGSELLFTFFLNFDIPNKNPYLALNGIDFGFPSYIFLAPLFDKRWNSSGHIVIYEEGNPIIIAEDDPAQTRIHTGSGNYVTNARYFDLPSGSFYNLTFKYENCGRDNDVNSETIPEPAFKKNTQMSTITRLKKILGSHSKNTKQELQEFKRQCLQHRKALTQN
jgi:hypothetical protein